MPSSAPDPLADPHAVYETIMALANTSPTDWRSIAKFLRALGWKLDRSGRLPDVIARKQYRPGPQVAAFVPQALYIEMGFSIGFTAAANIIHARQGRPAPSLPRLRILQGTRGLEGEARSPSICSVHIASADDRADGVLSRLV